MSSPLPLPRHLRRLGVVALTAIAVVVVAFSGSFGRAQPLGSYRPVLAPAALSNGCWPLPDGVALDFPYQVRTDGDVGPPGRERRHLVLQFDLIDVDTARQQVIDAFVSAGFTEAAPPSPAGPVLVKPGIGRVEVEATALAGVPDDSIVRGTIVLTLPSTQVQTDSLLCSDPYSTKRFPAAEAEPS